MDNLHPEEQILLRSLPMEMLAWYPLGKKALEGCMLRCRIQGLWDACKPSGPEDRLPSRDAVGHHALLGG